jgi:probable rRNA maturation factor
MSVRLEVQLATRARVPPAARLRRWARSALTGRAEVTIRVVGETEGRTLNRDYRGRDYATNVLSFPYGVSAGVLRGDIVLCAPVVAREAREQGKPLDAHYAHLTVHGVLHLRGYRHGRSDEARRMETRERTILRRLGYADPYRLDVTPA